ncbi:DUF1285 domain-containing protein [Algihabitans albus]|uniref:DUF1285 domain-containing protein n=1 Tax=Algihabitans albus TaxID=2164067 RepID=UPI001F3297F4|nr:DUF1285 domain-containing protein [Algihabitans albus]
MDGQSGGQSFGDTKSRGPADRADGGPSNDGPPTWPSCGDFDMKIARDGTWSYRGSPIGRKRLVKLFSSVLRREADGDYWLVTPVERGRIAVEDVPFIAEELVERGDGPERILAFRTNLDDWVEADTAHPLRILHDAESGEPTPYILVRDGLEARLARAVFYHLVELAVPQRDEEGRERLGVWSKGSFFPLDPPSGS